MTSVGVLAKTNAPVPVSSVTAAAKLAADGVARNVATLVPSPETPVLIGRPVALVSTPLAGVPSAGVTNVGLLAKTNAPVPVSSEITPASSLDEVAANTLNLFPVSATVPLVAGSVITVPVPATAEAITCAVPDDVPGRVTLLIPVRARFAEVRFSATLVVPMNVVSEGLALPLARSYADLTAVGVAARTLLVVLVESESWTIPAALVVAAATSTVGAVAVPPMVIRADPAVTLATLEAAASYAALTAVGVAARMLLVVLVESLSCTAPLTVVDASAMLMVGVFPPVEEIAPVPETDVTVPPPVASVCQAAPS